MARQIWASDALRKKTNRRRNKLIGELKELPDNWATESKKKEMKRELEEIEKDYFSRERKRPGSRLYEHDPQDPYSDTSHSKTYQRLAMHKFRHGKKMNQTETNLVVSLNATLLNPQFQKLKENRRKDK